MVSLRHGEQRWAWTLVSSVILQGCGVSLGLTSRTVLRERTAVGPELAARTHPEAHEGLMAGLEGAWLSSEAGTLDQWRFDALVGYSNLPARYEAPVGFEVAALGALGRVAVSTEKPYAIGFGAKGALPVRLSPRREPWESDSVLGPTFYLVPDISVTELFPVEGQDKWDVRHELAAGLALRIHFGTGLEP